jgi:hypothetical protein
MPWISSSRPLLADLAEHPRPVGALDLGRGQFEPALQLAVGGEEEQALGIEVEPADRDHARQPRRQPVVDRRATGEVALGGEQAGRLVEPEQAGRGGGPHRIAVDGDPGKRGEDRRRLVDRDAVQGDAAFLDHPLDLAARGDAGAGEELGEALRLAGNVAGFARLRDLALARRALAVAPAAACRLCARALAAGRGGLRLASCGARLGRGAVRGPLGGGGPSGARPRGSGGGRVFVLAGAPGGGATAALAGRAGRSDGALGAPQATATAGRSVGALGGAGAAGRSVGTLRGASAAAGSVGAMRTDVTVGRIGALRAGVAVGRTGALRAGRRGRKNRGAAGGRRGPERRGVAARGRPASSDPWAVAAAEVVMAAVEVSWLKPDGRKYAPGRR